MLGQMQECSGLGFPLPAMCQDGNPFAEKDYPARVAFQTRQPCPNQVMGVYQPGRELVCLTVYVSAFISSL